MTLYVLSGLEASALVSHVDPFLRNPTAKPLSRVGDCLAASPAALTQALAAGALAFLSETYGKTDLA
jgi:hypothetical protein